MPKDLNLKFKKGSDPRKKTPIVALLTNSKAIQHFFQNKALVVVPWF